LLLAFVLGELSAGTLPGHGQRSGDHPAHLANAVETQGLLNEGRVLGWTDFKFAGHLANVHYPPLASLMVAGVDRLLGDWDKAYDAVFLLILGLGAAMVFAFLDGFAGPVAAIAATFVAFFLDRGALWVGGRFFVIELGVWPFALSAFLAAGALALLPGLVRRPSALRALLLAVLIALAVLAHPFALLLIGLPGALRVALLPRDHLRPAGLLAVAGAGVLGLALTAWWLLPFLARSGELERWHADGVGGREALRLLFTGAVFRGAPRGLLPWALLGAWNGLRTSRGRDVLWAVLCAGIIWLLTIEPLWPHALRDTLESAQWVRLQILGRWLFFGLAGLGLEAVLRALGQRRWRSAALTALPLAACTALMTLPARERELHLGPCWSEEDDLALQDLGRSLSRGSGRVALYSADENRHCLMRLAAFAGRPYLKLGFTPADTEAEKFWTLDPQLLARTGVTEVVSDGSWPEAFAGLPTVARAGRFSVREIQPLPRAESLSPGIQVEVLSVSERGIRLRLSGHPGEARVRVYETADRGWRAFRDGTPVRLDVETVDSGRFLMLTTGPGVVDLRYAGVPALNAGTRLSAVAALAALAMLAVEAVRRLRRPRALVSSGPVPSR
jgi:hypothetical protein